ncbi:D-serine ammonia-lyase [Sinorhizobium meliloti]|uniref:D-serine ammonia-lyase n=1 Tax=Rhizobium meliloti TaxID=382 RepID=UPI0004185A21|nr:D-serine ammonia-lyase [Sinorhizobium meliloti]MCO6424203.1 D-serine ammonia-lyase [Sinorhizobium meliloti]MDW9632885.1 D-serine ammonia-lyase [Sinorhizobium meliloti]MDW9912718.1 D-serine ammonia-lyase [Sinorhizobium meliloti]MDW9922440.1 D-serine ammonia-lyase [Sinorhizobium meliloti]MDW9973661.1 D-serine ammonia-lyase [Sinorhizobium meliloti]
MQESQPIWWHNPKYKPNKRAANDGRVDVDDLKRAVESWSRFQMILSKIFSDIESGDGAQSQLAQLDLPEFLPSKVLVKADHTIKTTGSIKGRGGVYEVLSFAEYVLKSHGIDPRAHPMAPLSAAARALFERYKIVVGSTGNLAFSVGMSGRKLGFRVEVHMSRDAQTWKKVRLRDAGVHVVEHEGDYSHAVDAARKVASTDAFSYFVDDENSVTLLIGYSAAAREIMRQLEHSGIAINQDNPLFVYLPCGVGGAPGGITLGLKNIFGPNVHCIFVEPVASPCMLVQLASGSAVPVNVYACGLSNETIADGLAVAQASMLVAEVVGEQIAGVATVQDDDLSEWVERMWTLAGMRLEPSGAAGFAAFARHGRAIQQSFGSNQAGTTIIWTTGGSFLPDLEWAYAREQGQRVLSNRANLIV